MKTLLTALALVVGVSFTAMAHTDKKEVTTKEEHVAENGEHVTTEQSVTEHGTVDSSNGVPSEDHHVTVEEKTTVEKKHN